MYTPRSPTTAPATPAAAHAAASGRFSGISTPYSAGSVAASKRGNGSGDAHRFIGNFLCLYSHRKRRAGHCKVSGKSTRQSTKVSPPVVSSFTRIGVNRECIPKITVIGWNAASTAMDSGPTFMRATQASTSSVPIKAPIGSEYTNSTKRKHDNCTEQRLKHINQILMQMGGSGTCRSQPAQEPSEAPVRSLRNNLPSVWKSRTWPSPPHY